MTSKPDSVHWAATGTTLADASTQWCSFQWRSSVNLHNWNTLEDHWSHKYTDATGTTLADASTQWCPSGDPVLICIIGTHWKTTGKPLEDWKTIGSTLATNNFSPVAFQCTMGSKFQAYWIATGLPLEDHWLRVRVKSLCKHAKLLYYITQASV